MELFHANRQWSSRPADQRFATLRALFEACKAYAMSAVEADVQVNTLRVEAIEGDVQIVGRKNVPAKLTHWAFSQLCSLVAAPASYLRDLPATLAAQNLNHGLKERSADRSDDNPLKLLFHRNGDMIMRAITSDRYSRIWNYEVAERLLGLESQGWTPTVPDIRVDLDPEGYRAPLYASDHDMFAFLMHSDRVIKERGNPQGLKRGVIVVNSEVGASSLKLMRFLYREMCGNHIIWGAEDVNEIRVRHVGNVRDRFSLWNTEIRRYMDSSTVEDELRVQTAQSRIIGGTKDEVLDALFGKKAIGLSRKTLAAGYDANMPDVDGSPTTAWGMAQGLTRYSQTLKYADDRTAIDLAAGRILSVTF